MSYSKDLKFRSATLLKRDYNIGVFLWLLRNFKDSHFEKYLRTTASENLSRAAIWTFRRCFRSSSLSAFYEIGVFKISVKFVGKHTCRGLFSIKLRTFSLKFIKLKTALQIFFNEICKIFILKTPFYSTPRGDCFWYWEHLTFKSLLLDKFVHSINIVGTLYLISRNVDFRTFILSLSYHKNNF